MSDRDNFVGRSSEIDAFEDLLEDFGGQQGRALLIAGQPGVGKTSMALQFRELAEDRGFQALWAGFPEQGDRTPYGACIHLCRQLADFSRNVQAAELVDYLSRRAGTESSEDGMERSRSWLFEKLSDVLLLESNERRLAIFIDDLQCADKASASLIELMAKGLANLPVLLIATYRDTEVSRSGDTARLITSIAASLLCKRMALRGIDVAETAQLTHAMSGWLPDAEIVRRLHRQTEGNPLFLRHIIQTLIDQGNIQDGKANLPPHVVVPEGIREAIGFRLDRATPVCLSTLESAAILGRNFDIAILEQIASGYAATLIDEAVELGLIRPTNAALGRWQFTHSLIREVLYDRVTPMRRIRSHADAAEAIEQYYGTDDPETLPALAYHSFEGQLFVGTRRVIELARKAGNYALTVTAFEDAANQFQLALECLSVPGAGDDATRIDVALELAEAQRRAGDILACLKSCRQAIGWARRLGDWPRYTRAALLFEAARWQPGLPGQESLNYLLISLDHSGNADSADKSRLHYSLARAFQWVGRFNEAERHASLAIAIARKLNDERVLCDAMEYAVSSLSQQWEKFPYLVELASEQLDIARKLGDRHRIAKAILSLSTPLRQMGSFDELEVIGEEFQGLARDLGEPHFHYLSTSWATARAFLDGDFHRFEELAGQACETGRHISASSVSSLFGIQMFLLNRERGVLSEFAEFAIRQEAEEDQQVWRPGYALLLAEAGKLAEAGQVLEEYVNEGLDAVPRDELWLITMGFLGETSAIVDNSPAAAQIYDKLRPAAGLVISCGPSAAAFFGPVDRTLGRLQACMAEYEQAREWFEAALQQSQQWRSRLIEMRTTCDYADALIAEGTPASLKKARELDQQLSRELPGSGMRALVVRHEAIAHKLRELASSHGFDELTAREVEVLRQLTKGSSNADISRNLGISHPTVATHVRNILAKTDCRNRTAAAAYARQAGLVKELHAEEERN